MALDSTTLAQKMEEELGLLYVAAGKGSLPDLGRADRDMLFFAIAQAIVDHITSDAEVEVSDINLSQDPATGIVK